MKLNIKNARRLESFIDDEIVRLVGMIRSPEVSKATSEDAILETRILLSTYITKLSTLRNIRKTIRDSIGEFNVTAGINSITAEIALKNEDLELYTQLSKLGSPSPSKNYSTEQITYGYGLDRQSLEEYHVRSLKLKREIQRLKDRCQGINSSDTIELSDEVESFLKINGLMD